MRLFPATAFAAVSIFLAPLALAATPTAAADTDGAPELADRPAPDATAVTRADSAGAPKRSYGWQTLLVDGSLVAVSVTLFATQTGSAELLSPAAGVYLLGGPIVHAAHGRWEAAAGSFGLRVGLPLGGALVGAGIGSATGSLRCDHDCFIPNYIVGAVLGGVVGLIAAPVVDAAVLGYEPDPTATKGTVVVPTVSWVPGGASAGLAGQF